MLSVSTTLMKLLMKSYSTTSTNPCAYFPSGGYKVCVSTVPVEELLQHPDCAAGAETAHDDERKQQALPAT